MSLRIILSLIIEHLRFMIALAVPDFRILYSDEIMCFASVLHSRQKYPKFFFSVNKKETNIMQQNIDMPKKKGKNHWQESLLCLELGSMKQTGFN